MGSTIHQILFRLLRATALTVSPSLFGRRLAKGFFRSVRLRPRILLRVFPTTWASVMVRIPSFPCLATVGCLSFFLLVLQVFPLDQTLFRPFRVSSHPTDAYNQEGRRRPDIPGPFIFGLLAVDSCLCRQRSRMARIHLRISIRVFPST